MDYRETQEWLEADGLGGFASGTASGIRTRRYHATLLSARTPPTARQVLVSGLDVSLDTERGRFALSSDRYAPGVTHPDGVSRITTFATEPWPTWTFAVEDGVTVEQSLFVPRGLPVTVVTWRATGVPARASLLVRPFLACRDYHSMQRRNDGFRFDSHSDEGLISWRPYDGVATILASANARYEARADWYYNFEYAQERARGLDSTEDLATPGLFTFDISEGDAVLILGAETMETRALLASGTPREIAATLADTERRRRAAFAGPLERAGDAYLVSRGAGATIVAGYPWFTDWGRDTFISLRGLCLATGRYDEALGILREWAAAVSDGMLPNRFADTGEAPEYNAVDASLWFVVAVHELLNATAWMPAGDRAVLQRAVEAILDGCARGTRFGIRMDEDGLLAAGAPGVQLTWMDARVGDRVITPRSGKPVEIQALWINALWIASRFSDRWKAILARASAAFEARFWNEEAGCLFDVVDVDHVAGRVDASLRPNQLFAVGGLPLPVVSGARAARIVEAAEAHLLTPVGLRSLAPGHPAYVGRYAGGVAERDGAYHQGTVWPWLMGAFVEAWLNVRGNTAKNRTEARRRFLDPMLTYLQACGLGHLPEVADGDAPHRPGGCPFQAWSLAEAIRLDRVVLAGRTSNAAKNAKRMSQRGIEPVEAV